MKTPAVARQVQVDYSSTSTPDGYRCCVCHRARIKLWRISQLKKELCCVRHLTIAGRAARIGRVRQDGKHYNFITGFTDRVGSYFPAVPDVWDDEETPFWRYNDIPQDAYEWWQRLPLR